MEGLLLKLLEDDTGKPGFWFWKLFAPVRQDLDRLFWCFDSQPWMGAPPDFGENDVELFPGSGTTSIMLWRPGTLSRYASHFSEEYIDLWAIEPTQDNPSQAAGQYCASTWSVDVVGQRARARLIYTDSTCWEIFAHKEAILNRVRDNVAGKPWVEVYKTKSTQRGWAFGMAGLSEIWQRMK
ncbi:MAG: hypothetical protein U1E05_16400 [Patescibacteria group bacterium]|nr:hypothetical protein [Patescibacteria group bacterium]